MQGLDRTFKAKVGVHRVYVRASENADAKVTSLFIDAPSTSSHFRGLLNALSETVNVGLAAGVPLESFVDKMLFTRFPPNGVVEGSEDVKMATSVLDYAFRELAIHYLGRNDLKHKDN